ncbi:catalase family peroxidase [Streptomyces sp. NPDC086091]|uniref:catalase family peroxidase n=1 Tax=Streptomyces sp. NPDC086091 TaxID=3365751 RepID=UPI00380B54DA
MPIPTPAPGTGPVPSAAEVVDSMEEMSGGPFPGQRRSSARGICFEGTFEPSGDAAPLTTARHLRGAPVPVTVRFSNSEGNPDVPDGAPVTRGMAVRFHLPDGEATDLVALSVPRFVASTPEQFLRLTRALKPDPATGLPDMARVQAFVAAHPHLAEPIMQQPPVPVSYGTLAYWAVHAFVWVDGKSARRPVRYRWEPAAGREALTPQDAARRAADYLTDEFHRRLERAPVAFTLRVQLAEDDDPTHDPSVAWPEHRREIDAGRLVITAPEDDQEKWAGAAFSPAHLTTGIEPSDDPILAFRAQAYAESYGRRSRQR